MANEVRLQQLRHCIVQIRHRDTDAIVGTGFVVSTDGRLVTCGHVVVAAGVNPRKGNAIPTGWKRFVQALGYGDTADDADGEVKVYFEQSFLADDQRDRRATVVGSFAGYDDDVAVLKLVGGPSPLGEEHVAKLGVADELDEHDFRSFGYRRLHDHVGGWASGKIQGAVPSPKGLKLQVELVQVMSSQINGGMSGAPILDPKQNLVVGLISETWLPDKSTKDRDTGWVVNARILALDPLKLELLDQPNPLRSAPQPRADFAAQVSTALPAAPTGPRQLAWNDAPSPLGDQWVGREALLSAIQASWLNPNRRVAGLIGSGGTGKSSLARRWVDTLLDDASALQPDGVFWWSFNANRGVDEFFESALAFISQGAISSRKISSSDARAEIIGWMLSRGRYLFVLDGLETLQRGDGDQYGSLTSADLLQFIRYFGASGHQSFCLIASRLQITDLMDYQTYTQIVVDRLSPEEGRALLQKVGVHGPPRTLDRVVTAQQGHALSLNLLGSYVAQMHGGRVRSALDVGGVAGVEQSSSPVSAVLRGYEQNLSREDREFLMLFSVFRRPIETAALLQIFEGAGAVMPAVAALGGGKFGELVQRLVDCSLINRDVSRGQCTVHPLVRGYFLDRLEEEGPGRSAAAHAYVKAYYLAVAKPIGARPALEDLTGFSEAIYHACAAGTYDAALDILRTSIYQGSRRVLQSQFGAYDLALSLLEEFFEGGDVTQEPRITTPVDRMWLLDEVGLCLMNLGRLGEAARFFENRIRIALNLDLYEDVSSGNQNLAELHAYQGSLEASRDAASRALEFAQKIAGGDREQCYSLSRLGWAAHLLGQYHSARDAFERAVAKQPGSMPFYSQRAVQYADHLRDTGRVDEARAMTDDNLGIARKQGWVRIISQCRRILGDLAASTGQPNEARSQYDESLRLARGSSHLPSLVEVLLARGRYAARRGEAAAARVDLAEALSYAVSGDYGVDDATLRYAASGGYRIYEADIRTALAWASLADGDVIAAASQADMARELSIKCGYLAGRLNAEEINQAIQSSREAR